MPSTAIHTPYAARVATKAHFFVSGFLFAAWGVHIPTVKSLYGLSEAHLSWLMLAAGIGAILSLTRVGGWVARHGTKSVVLLSGMLLWMPLALLLHLPGFPALLAMLFVFGLASGAFDVAMNAEAVAVEAAYKRPIMSSFHGFFSLGGLAGAGLGSLVATLGIPASAHLLGAASAGGLIVWIASRHMLPMEATHSPDEAHAGFSLPSGAILLLGILAAAGLVGEGAMYDWSTLYMVKELDSPQQIAALGYGAFSGAMAVGRFGGDWIRSRLGIEKTLRYSSALSAAAMATTLLIGHPVAALIGFGLVGVGFSNVIPVLFSAAAEIPGVSPARGIAGVSSCGYLGLMLGPPLIGGIATHTSLSFGLFVVAVFAGVVALLAHRAVSHEQG